MAIDFAVFDFDNIAGHADNAFDEVGVIFTFEWSFENNDVVMFRFAEEIADFVNDDFFAEVVLALAVNNIEGTTH